MEKRDITEVLEYLSGARMFYIASCEGDQPRVRPFGFVMEYKNRMYFTTTSEKNFYMQTLENPKTELCIMGKQGTWMRLAGTVVYDNSPDVMEEKEKRSPHLDKLYEGGVKNPIIRVFYLRDCDARLYSFKGLVRKYEI